MGIALHVIAVVDDLRGRVIGPRHDPHGGGVGTQVHVAVARIDQLPVVVGVIPVDRLGEDALGQAQAFLLHELVRGHELAPRIAGHVRHQHLDLCDAVVYQPFMDGIHGIHFRV